MAKKNRDDFTEKIKIQIAKRAGWLCSYPPCRKATVGATSDGEGEINIGTAAHICAAAPGGPRYDPNMSTEDRRSAKNGFGCAGIMAQPLTRTIHSSPLSGSMNGRDKPKGTLVNVCCGTKYRTAKSRFLIAS